MGFAPGNKCGKQFVKGLSGNPGGRPKILAFLSPQHQKTAHRVMKDASIKALKDYLDCLQADYRFQLDINLAVQATSDEIFADALGDEPLEDDDDMSLEDMGEGLEGADLDEDDED